MLQVYKDGIHSTAQATMTTSLRASRIMSRMSAFHAPALLAAAALLLFACASQAVAGPSENAGGAFELVIANILNAWDSDPQAIAAQYESQGDFVSPDGMHAKGRRAIKIFYQGAFARGYAGSDAKATVIHVRKLSGTLALIDGAWSIEPTAASKIRQREVGLFFAVLRRHGGRWWIAALREQSSASALRELDAPGAGRVVGRR